MKFFVATTCVLLLATGILANPTIKDNNVEQTGAFTKCLESDSISCLQLTLYRKAKSFFDNPQIEIFGGVSLIKSNEGRQGKALDESALAVESAPTIEARTTEMGNYMLTNAKNFLAERSLNFNFANAARSVARAIPEDIKADLRELVVESRTKKKKLLKKFLPILLGVGAKVAVLGIGSIFGLLFIAKKALVISIIAFFLALAAGASSGLSRLGGSGGAGGLLGGLGGLFGGKSSGGASTGGGSSAGWSSGAATGGWSSGNSAGWDSHGAYSSPVAQTIAYSGYKQARR